MEKDQMHRTESSPGAAVISAVTQEEAPSKYQVQSEAYLQTNRHQQCFCHRSFYILFTERVTTHF